MLFKETITPQDSRLSDRQVRQALQRFEQWMREHAYSYEGDILQEKMSRLAQSKPLKIQLCEHIYEIYERLDPTADHMAWAIAQSADWFYETDLDELSDEEG